MRKSGYEDLYEYVKQYSQDHCGGKMATAILNIIRDHQQSDIVRSNIFVIQGDRIISKAQ